MVFNNYGFEFLLLHWTISYQYKIFISKYINILDLYLKNSKSTTNYEVIIWFNVRGKEDWLSLCYYENTNNCSLVITDYRMPQMSGLDFINKIREIDTNGKIKTIIISAYIKDNIPYDKSYIMKIDKILEKPVYLDRLKIEIQQLLTINIKEKIS